MEKEKEEEDTRVVGCGVFTLLIMVKLVMHLIDLHHWYGSSFPVLGSQPKGQKPYRWIWSHMEDASVYIRMPVLRRFGDSCLVFQ
ncbi:hypothetical protein EYF80_010811 [Liparis tanakae]|uniref:Uncharacterized protein n=1 Tax=Liparis tanakae TaxID=230148 RepID=A0A4Z2IM02_9TELE|nr:hypothetical protein EYF80_010811 [Liparis tanakae]